MKRDIDVGQDPFNDTRHGNDSFPLRYDLTGSISSCFLYFVHPFHFLPTSTCQFDNLLVF